MQQTSSTTLLPEYEISNSRRNSQYDDVPQIKYQEQIDFFQPSVKTGNF